MMIKVWCGLILTVLIAGGCVTTDVPEVAESSPSTDLSSSRVVVLTVYGLSCPLCANNVDGQLADLDGVERADIDLDTGAVTVHLAEGHSVRSEDLADAIENAGFTLKAIEPASGGTIK